MDKQDNPYQAPDAVSIPADTTMMNNKLISQGRLIFVGIVVFYLVCDLVLLLAIGITPNPLRLTVIGCLLFATWQGYDWGRMMLGLIIAVGIPFLTISMVRTFLLADRLLVSISLVIFGGQVFIFSALFYSNSLKAYCKRKTGGFADEKLTVKNDSQDLPEESTVNELFTVAIFDHRAMADVCKVVIGHEGISVFMADDHLVGMIYLLSYAVGGIKVQVLDIDAQRAVEIWHRTKPAAETNEPGDDTDVEFDCEECGKTVSFPGRRRGYVETCPHCGQYVDVPERE